MRIYILLLLSLFISCKNEDKFHKNEINKIVFATNGCEGNLPTEVIEIDSTMNIKYHGIKHTEKIGFYKGKANEKFWDTLNSKFRTLNYEKLDDNYFKGIDDGLYTEIYIHYKNKTKYISGSFEALPDNLKGVYKWLMLSNNSFKLNQVSDSLKFETQIEKPLKVSTDKILFLKK